MRDAAKYLSFDETYTLYLCINRKTHITFYKSGHTFKEIYHRNGYLHGKYVEYYNNFHGRKKIERRYKNSKKEGEEVCYFYNGRISRELQYTDGKFIYYSIDECVGM